MSGHGACVGLCLGGLVLAQVSAQLIDEPVSRLLQAPPPGASGVSTSAVVAIPLALPAPPTTPVPPAANPANGLVPYVLGRPSGALVPPRPASPAVMLRPDDRVLFLGDDLLGREAELGFLETRMTVQNPGTNVVFRHLSWFTNHALCRPELPSAETGVAARGLTSLANLSRTLSPSVVVLAYGSQASEAGESGLPTFQSNYCRLLDSLGGQGTSAAPRFVLLGPAWREPGTNRAEATNENARLERYSQAIGQIAESRNLVFVNVFNWLRGDDGMARQRRAGGNGRVPALTEDGVRLSAYGYSRLALAFEMSLHWQFNNWRVGLMGNGRFRDGGFGLVISNYARTDVSARLTATEWRLPSPNPPGYVELESAARPQCYVQIPGLKPGRYALQVDGREVIVGTHHEWGRYEIIAEGPSWDQAERLRQTIVRKNRAALQAWLGGTAPGDPPSAAALQAAEAAAAPLEQEIAALRVPVPRKFALVQIEALPEPRLPIIPTNAPASGPTPQ